MLRPEFPAPWSGRPPLASGWARVSLGKIGRCFAPLLTVLMVGCATLGQYPEPIKVTLADIRPMEMTLLEQRYLLKVRVQNPNDAALTVRGMSYEIALNGKEFAHGVSSTPFTVAGFSEQIVEGEIVSTVFSFYEQIRQLQKNPNEPFQYQISGSLSLGAGAGRVPFEYKGELDFSPADLQQTL